jgi:two-component system sensor kinase FixL
MTDSSPTSEARYQFLVERSGDIITTHRPGDWAYTSINPALERVSGFSKDELMGMSAYKLFHPDDAEAMQNKLIPAIYHHGARTFRYRSRHKDGYYTWMETTHSSVRDADGKLLEIIAVTRDISAQVKAEEANRRLAMVVEASFALILFCDRHHRVSHMNQATRDVLRMNAVSERVHLRDLLGEDNYDLMSEAFAHAATHGSWNGVLRICAPQAPDRYLLLEEVLAHSRAELGKEGNYYSLIVRDSTEQKMVERRVRDQQSELIHASRVMTLGEMASGLAHEINQPLATTLNYARGALRKLESGQELSRSSLNSVFDIMVRQTQLAADIVKRLRSLVKKTPYQRTVFSVQQVLKEVEELLNHDLWSHSVIIQYDLPEEELVMEGDRIQIQQVLFNLIRNSMDAYQKVEAEQRKVFIRLSAIESQLELSLEDHAGGIPESLANTIFEPYISSKQTGLGMGLSISRSIIEAHGGQIFVHTDSARVTQFTLRLPRLVNPSDEEG